MGTQADGRRRELGAFAKAGFQELTSARDRLAELVQTLGTDSDAPFLEGLAAAADPDAALGVLLRIADHVPDTLSGLDAPSLRRLCMLLGASPALGEFLLRHPSLIDGIASRDGELPSSGEARERMLEAITTPDGVAVGEAGWVALRVKYRELLAGVAMYDLCAEDAADAFEAVAATLSLLADAAIEAALAVARATLIAGASSPPVSRERVDAVRLAVIAMGKCGADELNVVSDVDVMFIVEGDERLGMNLARETMRAIHDPSIEPALWQLDANLRPEGRQGALVRTMSSMMAYYERWAKTWEFQALIKARASAGDLELGEEFVERTRALVWASGKREDFVGSVQRMRERITEHIDTADPEYQLKLGPGGLRDVEFSVQLLQLVHGGRDERLQLRGTLPALRALVEGGYIARKDGEQLSADYRFLRVLEHRLQLRDLRRTALMPQDPEALRTLARATGFASTADELVALWTNVKREVRKLHLKIFYAPLLSAVAALSDEEFVLGTDAARARLASIGFKDPEGAFRHLAALTGGTSRRARILRNLSPVLLQWLADGTDPDYGLLAFRRVSEANESTPWYLRLLRDGSYAAERLARVLANSRFAADLLESYPEGVAWLEKDARLAPPEAAALHAEMTSLVSRRPQLDQAGAALRGVHRREVLRLAMGRVCGVLDDREVAQGLDGAHSALLDGLLSAIRRNHAQLTGQEAPEIALIGMGRYGGGELGFSSDIDIMAVTRGIASRETVPQALRVITELRSLVSDPRFPVDLDFDLRPEGKSGPLVRTLESYRSYYERWSATWEAQALLRARFAAGSEQLARDFFAMADPIRYPEKFSAEQLREVRRIKARVEGERLPQGADPSLHVKLGPGGISDVEWLVQLIQLEHAHAHESLRTVSTLDALQAAVSHGLIDADDAASLRETWLFASTARSAMRLWSGRVTDLLPRDWRDLAGIAGVLDLPRDKTSEIIERWLMLSRRSREVFEREFYGVTDEDRYPEFFG